MDHGACSNNLHLHPINHVGHHILVLSLPKISSLPNFQRLQLVARDPGQHPPEGERLAVGGDVLGVVHSINGRSTRTIAVLVPIHPHAVASLPVFEEVTAIARGIAVVAGVLIVSVVHGVGVDGVVVDTEIAVRVAVVGDQGCLLARITCAGVRASIRMPGHEDESNRGGAGMAAACADLASARSIFVDQRLHRTQIVGNRVAGDVAPGPHHHIDGGVR